MTSQFSLSKNLPDILGGMAYECNAHAHKLSLSTEKRGAPHKTKLWRGKVSLLRSRNSTAPSPPCGCLFNLLACRWRRRAVCSTKCMILTYLLTVLLWVVFKFVFSLHFTFTGYSYYFPFAFGLWLLRFKIYVLPYCTYSVVITHVYSSDGQGKSRTVKTETELMLFYIFRLHGRRAR